MTKGCFTRQNRHPIGFWQQTIVISLNAPYRRYPDQFWAEIVAYRIGSLLGAFGAPRIRGFGVAVQEACGALIEWFPG